MSDEIQNAIIDSATGPKRVETGAGTVDQHSLKDLIAADKHLAGKAAVKTKHRGLLFNKLVPPGAD